MFIIVKQCKESSIAFSSHYVVNMEQSSHTLTEIHSVKYSLSLTSQTVNVLPTVTSSIKHSSSYDCHAGSLPNNFIFLY